MKVTLKKITSNDTQVHVWEGPKELNEINPFLEIKVAYKDDGNDDPAPGNDETEPKDGDPAQGNDETEPKDDDPAPGNDGPEPGNDGSNTPLNIDLIIIIKGKTFLVNMIIIFIVKSKRK